MYVHMLASQLTIILIMLQSSSGHTKGLQATTLPAYYGNRVCGMYVDFKVFVMIKVSNVRGIKFQILITHH